MHHFKDNILNTFSWMKMYEFWLTFHWSVFQSIKLLTFQHWFRLWLGTNQVTSHYLNQWCVYWCLYASLGLNELIEDSKMCYILNLISSDCLICCMKCIMNSLLVDHTICWLNGCHNYNATSMNAKSWTITNIKVLLDQYITLTISCWIVLDITIMTISFWYVAAEIYITN